MSNKIKSFLDYFDSIAELPPMPEDAAEFLQSLRDKQEEEENKPLFTETGIAILEYLQTCGQARLKAKDIADGMGLSSRKVSGSIRKLVTDNYVDKVGSNPVIYTLTDQGKNFNIENYKGE
jgi:DNA-binding MarR family transcriptional regulator